MPSTLEEGADIGVRGPCDTAAVTTYLAFLRAINLGATRVFPKGDIVRAATDAGFEDVRTHLGTGNVRLDSRMRSRARVETTLEDAFARDRGFEVPTIVFSAADFRALAEDAATLNAESPGLARHYIYLLKEVLDADTAHRVEETATDEGRMVVRGRAVHALLLPGYQDGRVDPLGATKLLGVATNRTLAVVQGLAERWC